MDGLKFDLPLLTKKEGSYIESCYRKKTGGNIPDPWMFYPKHEDWDVVVERLQILNTEESIWAGSMSVINNEVSYEKRNL